MSFAPSTPAIVSYAYNNGEKKKSHACDKVQADLKKAIAYAWKQPALTKKRSDADWKVTGLTKDLAKCRAADAKRTHDLRSSKRKKAAKKTSADLKELSEDVFHGVDAAGDSAGTLKYVGLAAAAVALYYYYYPQIKALYA
jgi:hypothetical protein